ncbi:MAG: NAD(P)H-hydrate epimerase [Tepidisphaeraceae bacterium]|jgi:NAD(P)H-hydrate epimerase
MPALTRQQVRQIDKLAAEKYQMLGEMLMENAARSVADVAGEMLAGNYKSEIAIVCGGGNNGGDGLAAARHLHNRGANVKVFLTIDPLKYNLEALTNWRIIESMRLMKESWEYLANYRPHLIIDAIFGTGLTQPPREPFSKVVAAMHGLKVPILAVDIPSGLDCDTGKPLGPACVKATRTITFVAEKVGFQFAKDYTGVVTVGDIGCPRELIEEVQNL